MGLDLNPEIFIKRVRIETIKALYPDPNTRPDYAKMELSRLQGELETSAEIPEDVAEETYQQYRKYVSALIVKGKQMQLTKIILPLVKSGNSTLDKLIDSKIKKELGESYQLETGADGLTSIFLRRIDPSSRRQL